MGSAMKACLGAAVLGAALLAAALAAGAPASAQVPAAQSLAPPGAASAATYTKCEAAYRGFGLVGGEYPFVPAIAEQQQKQFDAALAALQPQRPGVHDVYLLAAGLWGEHVFESEAAQAADILVKRYGAQGRAIVLSNNFSDTSSTLPGATPGNFFAALNKIGSLMDKDEDLFVMFVTSHGGEGQGIGLHDRDRMEYLMTPANLRDALDKAGIKKRVLIIAACYAGQFIPAFNDQDTIVITAAAADRTSFGCQAERDWTYFGDAFFNHALRAGGGLVPAFQKAKKEINAWETKEGDIPSNPQLYVGVNAARLLGAIEAALPAPPL
jgi:Peptidase C13 family